MNYVLICGSYYPVFSAVGKCQFYIAKELVRLGHNVHVISITQDEDLETEDFYQGQYLHRILLKRRNRLGTVINRGIKRLSLDILDRELLKLYIERLNSLVVDPDVIVPVCSPFESVYASMLYKTMNKKCKVVTFLYDKFATSNSLYKWNIERRVKIKHTKSLERTALQYCDGILYVDSWTSYLNTQYRDLNCVSTCIEHPLITPLSCEPNAVSVGDNISIIFAGMLTKDYVEPSYFIECLRRFHSIDNIMLKFFSQGNAIDELEVTDLPIKNYGWVEYDVLLKELQKSSVLLSISEINGIQISSKIFEYMSLGKPIVHIYYVDNDVNLKYLNNYPSCLCIKADMNALEENALILESWLRKNANTIVEYSIVEKEYYKMTPRFVCEQLVELVAGLF